MSDRVKTWPCIEGRHSECAGTYGQTSGGCECECHYPDTPEDWQKLPRNTDEPLYKVFNPVEASTRNILKVMEEGEQEHEPGSWAGQSIEEHIDHADLHMQEVRFLLSLSDATPMEEFWEAVEHAHCRLSMALHLRDNPSALHISDDDEVN